MDSIEKEKMLRQMDKVDNVENISDGYHTFKELYQYRLLYNAAFFNALAEKGLYTVVKSHRHSTGEECFGGGWFVVMAELPTGQISNHYENKYWNLFKCEEVNTAPVWDGHTPQMAAERLLKFLDMPQDSVPESPDEGRTIKYLQPFNLEKAKAGSTICTKGGDTVTIQCWDAKNPIYPIIGVVTDKDGFDWFLSFTKEGKCIQQNEGHTFDLAIQASHYTGYISIFRKEVTLKNTEIFHPYFLSPICKSKKQADEYIKGLFKEIKDASKNHKAVGTVKIEWDD